MMRVNILEKLLNKHSDRTVKFSIEKGFNEDSYQIRIVQKNNGYTCICAEINNEKQGLFTIYGSDDFNNPQLRRIKQFAETPVDKREPFDSKNVFEKLRYQLMDKDNGNNKAFASSWVDDDLAHLTFIGLGAMVICYFNYDEDSLLGERPDPDALFTLDLNSLDVNWINPKTDFKIKNVILDFQNELHEKGSFDLNLVKPYEDMEEH